VRVPSLLHLRLRYLHVRSQAVHRRPSSADPAPTVLPAN
jgi:hypothetical protein